MPRSFCKRRAGLGSALASLPRESCRPRPLPRTFCANRRRRGAGRLARRLQPHPGERIAMTSMRAAVFEGKGKIAIREVPRPEPGVGQALIRVTLTTIYGTDVHIFKAEYPVRPGLVVGHEPVGVVEAIG